MKGGESLTKKKRYGKSAVNGRRTVDYFELITQLEEAQQKLGFKTFAEFARQIARDYLQKQHKLL
jgi:hypothetical protein